MSLGEGNTPLIPSLRLGDELGVGLWFKLEGANPTGSFKDRGAAVMVAVLREKGARVLADDSSGNAGAALAAYCARAGIPALVFVPAYASGPKVTQIKAFGATLVAVHGPRPAATQALLEACSKDPGISYASHNLSPYFLAGLRTLAYELFLDLEGKIPEHVVVPLGGGGLFLGLFYGFFELFRLQEISKIPKIHAVQPQACAPIVKAFLHGKEEPEEVIPEETVAEGTRIPKPARGAEVLWALRQCQGKAVSVSEEEIIQAQEELARREGIFVEPTSALALSGLKKLIEMREIKEGERVVLPLTGSGLKAGGGKC